MQKGNCMITIQKVVKWVNLLAVNIPNTIAEKCGVQEGSAVKLKIKSNKIAISEQKYDLDTLLNQITDENQHQEVDWGSPQGKELW